LIAFDIVALVVIGFFAFNGLRKGLITELFKIIGVVAGLILGLQTIPSSSGLIHQIYPIGANGEKALGFILVFIGVMLLSFIIASFVKKIMKLVLLGWLDHSGGTLLGGIKGALIISSLMPLLAIMPDSVPHVKEIRRQSLAYHYLNGFAPQVYNVLGRIFPGSKSFAAKLKESFPSMGSLTKMSGVSGTEAQEESLKQIQQFMGGTENPTMDVLKKQLEEIDPNDYDLQKAQNLINQSSAQNKNNEKTARKNKIP